MAKKKKGKKTKTSKTKLKMAQRGFLWSLVFTVASFLLYTFSSTVFFENLFGILLIIFGFVGLAFLISLTVLWFAKKSK